jgi:predicted esterase
VTGHRGEPLLAAGTPLDERRGARAVVVALHGRGADAEGILGFLVDALEDEGEGVALLAPQARHATWYPKSFLAPVAENEPWLSSALARVGEVIAGIERDGVPAEKIVLFGFSQGACLASEFVARHPRRYGALVAATGGRIGPPGTDFANAGDLAATPIHLSAGDPDPHVPWSRIEESAASFRALNGWVTTHREPGFPHAVHPTAVAFLRDRLAEL